MVSTPHIHTALRSMALQASELRTQFAGARGCMGEGHHNTQRLKAELDRVEDAIRAFEAEANQQPPEGSHPWTHAPAPVQRHS